VSRRSESRAVALLRPRAGVASGLWVALLAVFAAALLALTASAAWADGTLRIHFVDVGQGDGMVIRSPEGRIIIVDAGPRRGAQPMMSALKVEGAEAIDLAIMSHPHLDHLGGMEAIFREVPPRLFLDPGFDHPSQAYLSLLNQLEALEVPVRLARAGRTIDIGGASLHVLFPEDDFITGTRSDPNTNSIVLMLTHGDVRVLLTGDAEVPTEQALLASGADLTATVLKVAHHGSRHSTQPGFLARVSPQVAVISCGAGNSYGHPAPELLERLEAAGIEVRRTDTEGTVTLESDGRNLTWTTDRDRERAGEPPLGRAVAVTTPSRFGGPTAGGPTAGGAASPGADELPEHAFVASQRSKVYHAPWCRAGRLRIAAHNRVLFDDREAAEASGRRPAQDCGPEPAPSARQAPTGGEPSAPGDRSPDLDENGNPRRG